MRTPRISGYLRQPIELRPHVVDRHVGVADDAVRPAARVGHLLHPGDLVLEFVLRPVRLHVDRLHHARAGEVLEELVDQVVAPDRPVGAEDARLHRAGQPRHVGLPPDVMVRIDDVGHAARLPSRFSTCAQTAPTDEPSARSSTSGRIAFSPSVCGLKFGSAASGVSQLTRQARRDEPRHRLAHRGRIAALEPVGEDRARRRRANSRRSAARRGRPARHRRCACRRPSR